MVEFINQWKAEGKKVPHIVARLRGTGEEQAREILKKAAIPEIEYFADLRPAAEEAVRLAGGAKKNAEANAAAAAAREASRNIVTFSRDGQYEQTLNNLKVKQGDPVMVLGMGKAAQANTAIAKKWGTNIVGATAPNKGGQELLGTPVFNTVAEGVAALKPRIASVFAPPVAAADAIIECIEAEIPLIVSYAEGVPTQEQLKVQRVLRSQNKSRVVGANCPGVIFPHERVKLGIQPLQVHSAGCVGIATRSGTISYELAAQTTALGLGQSVVYGLGGDPFPSTRTWEALQLILEDPKSKFAVLVGEVGGQSECKRASEPARPKGVLASWASWCPGQVSKGYAAVEILMLTRSGGGGRRCLPHLPRQPQARGGRQARRRLRRRRRNRARAHVRPRRRGVVDRGRDGHGQAPGVAGRGVHHG